MAAVPALMYFISNNLNFVIIKELGPTNFQLLNNLKILATAIFFRYGPGGSCVPHHTFNLNRCISSQMPICDVAIIICRAVSSG